MHYRFVIATLLAGSMLPSPRLRAQQPDSVDAKVVFAIRPTGSEAADRNSLDVLAKYLEARQVTTTSAISIAALITESCGTAKVAHVEKFLELNPNVEAPTLAPGTTVAIPPCPYWSPNAEYVIGGSPVDSQIKWAMGTAGPITVSNVKRTNSKVFKAARKNLYGKSIILPYVIDASAFTLKQRYAKNPNEALRAIAAIPGAIGASLDVADLELLRALDPATAEGECRAPSAQNWPFDPNAVLAVMKRNAALFPRISEPRGLPIIIGIADTGIEKDEARLPLHITEVEQRGAEDEDRDDNEYRHDVIGTVLHDRRGYPGPDPGYKFASHGTGVAGLAIGGILPADLHQEVRRRISLKIMSYVQRQSFQADTPISVFSIPREALLRSISYRPENQPLTVINLSVQTTEPIELFETNASSAPSLIVVAAGNAGVNLGNLSIYPAAYRSPNIITVAAHNQISAAEWAQIRANPQTPPSFAVLTSFSNYGKGVDLAAPGCMVPTLGLNGTEVTATGTSFAAPLVSFTAGLLASYRITSTKRIRSRILASVDIVPGLKVTTSGVLNIAKALTVFEDRIETTDGEVILGRITNDHFDLDDTAHRIGRVLKIVPNTTGGLKVFLRSSDDDDVDIETGTTKTKTITIKETEGGRVRRVQLDQIRDVTFMAPEHR
jgi:hypothetical protein